MIAAMCVSLAACGSTDTEEQVDSAQPMSEQLTVASTTLNPETMMKVILERGLETSPPTWSGTAPFCQGACEPNQHQYFSDRDGDGQRCQLGEKKLCGSVPEYRFKQTSWSGTAFACEGACPAGTVEIAKGSGGGGQRCWWGWKKFCAIPAGGDPDCAIEVLGRHLGYIDKKELGHNPTPEGWRLLKYGGKKLGREAFRECGNKPIVIDIGGEGPVEDPSKPQRFGSLDAINMNVKYNNHLGKPIENWFAADGSDLPLADHTADIVIVQNTFIPGFLPEVTRVLAKQGTILLTGDNWTVDEWREKIAPEIAGKTVIFPCYGNYACAVIQAYN
ncbi:MAG: hypothetical protein RIG26_09680 [Thalassospira sp.]